jgi:hypothetical protein
MNSPGRGRGTVRPDKRLSGQPSWTSVTYARALTGYADTPADWSSTQRYPQINRPAIRTGQSGLTSIDTPPICSHMIGEQGCKTATPDSSPDGYVSPGRAARRRRRRLS